MSDRASGPKAPANSDPRLATIRLRVTDGARRALAAALAERAPGSGVRLWVERGMRPHAQMMIDRPSPRDVPLRVDHVLLLLDETSLSLLRDAEVRYRDDRDPAGFEVVGPFLPASAPAPGPSTSGSSEPAGTVPAPAAGSERGKVEERVRESLKNIYDPEIPMNDIDHGLIYGMEWNDRGGLTIRMTLTSPGCPAVEAFTEEVTRTAREASGLSDVKVDIVWEPPWGPERMSEFARRQFGYA